MLVVRKDLLQDVVHLTNCCREEYFTSSQAVQTSVSEVKKDQEYTNFITKHRYLKLCLIWKCFFLLNFYILESWHHGRGHCRKMTCNNNYTVDYFAITYHQWMWNGFENYFPGLKPGALDILRKWSPGSSFLNQSTFFNTLFF